MTISKFIRQAAMGLACTFATLMMTFGSPIPLWHFDTLEQAVAVESITNTHLVTEGGDKITLPFIREIPHDNPLFAAAVAEGIEVNDDGSVIGLMWLDRNCAMDLTVWRVIRVNLSDLSGLLNPKGIDESIIPAEVIAFQVEQNWIPAPRKKNHLRVGEMVQMRQIRKQFEYSAEQAKLQAE